MTTSPTAGEDPMAASILLPSRPLPQLTAVPTGADAGPVLRASVPQPGDAVVVRIDSRGRPEQARPTPGQYRRRRIAALAAAVVLVLLGVLGARAAGAAPTEPDPIVGGHAVIEPGMTLWDVADAFAPDGEDVRAYLHDLRELNGIDAEVPAWSVVALPPR